MDPTNALNARAAQSLGPDSFSSPAGEPPRSPGVHPVPDTPHLAPEATPPTPAAPTHAAPTHSLVPSGGEQCPSCAAHVAPDQRYCLACGARCGEPRLPFMSAVTFMDAMKTPAGGASSAPPRHPQRRISSNTALFATIGVLLLAMGVGVLIGRSGNHTVASTPVAPQIIKVGGGGEEAKAEVSGAETGKTGGSGSPKKASKKVLKKEASSQGDTENLLHAKVPLVKAGTQIGGACEEGTAGCKGKKFTGEFFGE
jgi:hypothetical protein